MITVLAGPATDAATPPDPAVAAYAKGFALVADVEGELSLDPADSGNWTGGKVGVGVLEGTKYGISAASFPMLDIAAVTLDQARAIFKSHYWDPLCCDRLAAPVAVVIFDCAVNQGVHCATITLQRASGADPDGWIGSRTLELARMRPPRDLVLEICARRAVLYAEDALFAADGLGWMRRLMRVASAALAVKE